MKLSIILPVYNVASYLQECLESVVHEPETEVIAIDDGSTDGSGRILDDYAAKFYPASIIVEHTPNLGVAAARNRGLDLAQGDWVLFLDGDDYFEAGALSSIRELIRNHPTSHVIRFNAPRSRLYCFLWQCAYKRSMIGNERFKSYACGEDREFYVRLISQPGVVLSDSSLQLYRYRMRSGSATHRRRSVRDFKDELAYRLDIIERVSSGVAWTKWLELFPLFNYLVLALLRPEKERRELLDFYRVNLPRIRAIRTFSSPGKLFRHLVVLCLDIPKMDKFIENAIDD